MMNIKIPSKINIYLFFIFSMLISSNISYADKDKIVNNLSLEKMLNQSQSTKNNVNKQNSTDQNQTNQQNLGTPSQSQIMVAYTINIPQFMPTKLPNMYPSRSKISNRVVQISDEITSLAKTTKKLYNQTIENHDKNNKVYTKYRKIIDNINAILDTGNSLPGDPELTQKVNVAYQLLETIKHNLSILQTLNMGVKQQVDINEFLVASIKRTQNIEVANNNDKLNLKRLAKIISHNTLYLKYFRNNFQEIMTKHQLLISKITSELSRVNAGVIAGKSIKVIFQENQQKMGKINVKIINDHYMLIKD